MEIYFGKALANVKMNGRMIPGHKWWRRNEETLLFGQGMQITTFQVMVFGFPSNAVQGLDCVDAPFRHFFVLVYTAVILFFPCLEAASLRPGDVICPHP